MTREWLRVGRDWLGALAGMIYPDVCKACENERATREQGYVGERCREAIPYLQAPMCERCGHPFPGEITDAFSCSNCRDVPLHFTYARSVVAARGVVREVIHLYKYHKALWFEPFLVELLLQGAVPALERSHWDAIVPVPLHPRRRREREFNQAENLARPLGSALGLPVHTRALVRLHETRAQARLSREARAENVRGAFALGNESSLRGGRVILVDDVLTTGATTNSCARVLRKAGVDEVCVWTVARGLLD